MRSEPAFAAAVQRGVVGDDPLGLAPTNEKLYNSALPGFNNYVRYIRVYAALCWTVKQVESAMRRGQARSHKEAAQLLKGALEKTELALVWFNKGAPQLAGTKRDFPATDRPVELKFKTFSTSEASLFEAVTYRPSLTSLGFLEARSSGTYACLPAGDRLAQAYEDLVRQAPGGQWLRTLSDVRAGASRIAGLAEVLRLDEPSAQEQEAFLAQFFPRNLPQQAPSGAQARFLTLRLLFLAIAAESGAKRRSGQPDRVTIEEARACMARGEATDGAPVALREHATVQAWWAVLQLRQLQRIAQEAIYCVVERWIGAAESAGRPQPLAECVEELGEACAKVLATWELDSVGKTIEYLEGLRGGSATLYQAAARFRGSEEDGNEACVFEQIASLQDTASLEIDDDGCLALAHAYFALVFCALEARHLQANPEALSTLKADGDACSLLRLCATVDRYRAASAVDLFRFWLKDWVILRHFHVVATRSLRMDGKNRFRFIVGDEGLERFDKGARLPRPGMSEDKLAHAIYLCTQAGLLSERDGGYKLTAKGRAHAGLH